MATNGWVRVGARRNNLTDLAECLNREGVAITPLTLERTKLYKSIPYVQIAGKRYTRREWVQEWLEAQKTTAPQQVQPV